MTHGEGGNRREVIERTYYEDVYVCGTRSVASHALTLINPTAGATWCVAR